MKEKTLLWLPRVHYDRMLAKHRIMLPDGTVHTVHFVDAKTGEIWLLVENSYPREQAFENVKALTSGRFIDTELIDLTPKIGMPRQSFFCGTSTEDNEAFTIANCAPGVLKYLSLPITDDFHSTMAKIEKSLDHRNYITAERRAEEERLKSLQGLTRGNLKKEFPEIFESEMERHGFSRRQAVFFRITVGKMVQMISYTKFFDDYTLQYMNLPLCNGTQFSLDFDGQRLSEVVLCWKITDDNTETLKDALEACKLIILPKLDKISDYRSYYEESKNNYKISALCNKYDKARPNPLFREIVSPAFYNISMQLGDFETPQAALENMFKFYEIDPNTDPSSWRDNARKLYELIEAHKRGDDDYIKNSIEADEAHSLESFKNNIIGKRKLKADGKINFYEVKKDNYEY